MLWFTISVVACLCMHVLVKMFILDSCLVNYLEKNVLLAFCSKCFYCGAVALSASFFSFGVLDRRCQVIVSIPDHCLPFYLLSNLVEVKPCSLPQKSLNVTYIFVRSEIFLN